VTHFVYLIRGRKVGATRDRLRDRLREEGHDLPHRVTDDGRVLPGDPDVEVLAVYTKQSDERMGDAEWAFARAHRLSRETHFGDRALMSERGPRGAAVANTRRVRCPHCVAKGRQPGERGEVARTGEVRATGAPSRARRDAEECWTGATRERPYHSPLRTPSDETDARNQWLSEACPERPS